MDGAIKITATIGSSGSFRNAMKLRKIILIFRERESNGRLLSAPIHSIVHTAAKWTALVQFRYFRDTIGENVRRAHSPVKLKKHLNIQNKPATTYATIEYSVSF